MERHTIPEKRRIVSKHSEHEEGVTSEEAAAESRPIVFSSPSAPEERMLTFRRRSLTRVFVRKKFIADKEPGKVNNLTRVLGSGKRLYLSEPRKKTDDHYSAEWAEFEENEKEKRRFAEPFALELERNEMADVELQGVEKMFKVFYSRKRPRNSSWVHFDLSSSYGEVQAIDPRFKVFYSRKTKNKKPKVGNDLNKLSGSQFGVTEDFFRAGVRHGFLQFKESRSNLLETVGINGSERCTPFWDLLVLVRLTQSSSDHSSSKLGRFLLSVISWMRRVRMNMHNFVAFLLSDLMSNAFFPLGIHFLPVTDRNRNLLLGSCNSNFGSCKIYRSPEFHPLVSLNFLALPSYFKSLHMSALLGTQYFDFSLSTYFMGLNKKLNINTQVDDCKLHVRLETGCFGTTLSSSVSAIMKKKTTTASKKTAVVARRAGIYRGSRLRKLQRKRSLKLSNARKLLTMNCHRKHENFIDDPFINHRNKVSSTLPVSHSKIIEINKNKHGEQVKEIKAAICDIKQNIDSVQLNANLLVTAGDRCWREEGAVVLLNLSSSREWCLVVKIGSRFRYVHCSQDMKYTLNRFTHAYMWIVEDGLRLEFSEKLDWLIFKELHAECRQRNYHPVDASLKVIPVPVFKDVPTYQVDSTINFVRPEQYILMKHDDEILRATVSEAPYYDMDSEDEEWLQKHTSSTSTIENGTSFLSEDIFERMIFSFERMIFSFEKNAYYNSSNVIPLEREQNNDIEFGSQAMVSDIYDYWLKKRKQRRGPLVKVFQGVSPRKPQLMQRPVLRKRRSLKRQRSQVGRGKPTFWFNSKAKEEAKAAALLKVHEANNAWRESMEAAIPLRRRAQLLMENADLAAYKSVMALRIAEAIRSSSEASSSFLDWFPE